MEFGLTRVLVTTILPSTHTPWWCRVDPGLGAAATRVPAASREDSLPQAILKFQLRISFDYRVRYEPQIGGTPKVRHCFALFLVLKTINH